MRENKRVLKFRKFKIANLQVRSVVGGTDSNPCVPTGPVPSEGCPTVDDYTCIATHDNGPATCTKGKVISDEGEADCRG